jgi:hypothetical protein
MQENENTCAPCVLPVALTWYWEALEEHGRPELGAELRQLADGPEITALQLAQKLDKIKDAVTGGLRSYLKELDCTLQVNANNLIEEDSSGSNNQE